MSTLKLYPMRKISPIYPSPVWPSIATPIPAQISKTCSIPVRIMATKRTISPASSVSGPSTCGCSSVTRVWSSWEDTRYGSKVFFKHFYHFLLLTRRKRRRLLIRASLHLSSAQCKMPMAVTYTGLILSLSWPYTAVSKRNRFIKLYYTTNIHNNSLLPPTAIKWHTGCKHAGSK